MTSSSRSTDTTARGSDSSRKPSTRIGSVRMANRAMASTSSPVVTAPSRQPPRPDAQQGDRAQAWEGVERRLEGGPQVADAEALLTQAVGGGGEAALLVLGQAEGLHDQGAVEALVGDRRRSPKRACTSAAGSSTWVV